MTRPADPVSLFDTRTGPDVDDPRPTPGITVDAFLDTAGGPVAVLPPAVRRSPPVRRGPVVAVVVVLAALAVSAFAGSGPATGVDEHFVAATRAQGYAVEPGAQQALLVSAAHKICERKENHATVAQRRATALSTAELATVTDTFAGNARSFTVLALETYCTT